MRKVEFETTSGNEVKVLTHFTHLRLSMLRL